MKTGTRTAGILLALCMLFCGSGMTGCSRASDAEMMDSAPAEMYFTETEAAEDIYMDKAASTSTSAQTGSGNITENDLENRKLIRNANLNVETKAYDSFMEALDAQIASHGGYVQSGETSGSADRGNRWASYTVRVPESRYAAFLSTVSALGTVTYRNENVQDVTMEYTDVEARIRALETEHDTLLAILEKCENLEDVITVQSRVTEVQYELDSYKSRMRRYDDLISYCTIHLSVDEVEKVTVPVAEQTLGERIAEDLAENCEDIVDDAEDFAVWFVSSLPYFGIWLVVIGVTVLVVLRLWKRSARKLEERNRMRAAEAETGSPKED